MHSLITFFKNITLAKKILLLITPIISMLITVQAASLGLFLLIFLDLLTGIRKNLHLNNISFNPFKAIFYRSIKSYLLRQTLKKTYEYLFAIIALIIFESLVFGSMSILIMSKVFTFTELGILLCASIELWSIGENMEAVSGKNIFKKMMEFLPLSIQKLFNKNI